MAKPGKSGKVKRIEIRSDLKQFCKIEDEQNCLIKCTVEGCFSKASEGPTILKFNHASGWYNFERHLLSAHEINVKTKASSSESILKHVKIKFKSQSSKGGYKKNDLRQASFEKDLLDFICIDGAPLNVSSKPAFVNLIKNRDKMLHVPSRKTVTKRIFQNAQKIRSQSQRNLQSIPPSSLHMSLDLWTSRAAKSVLGMRVYYIDAAWNLKHETIGFKHFEYTKTGHNMRLFVKKFMDSFGILPAQVGVVMADNASENVKAFNLSEFQQDCEVAWDNEDWESEGTESESKEMDMEVDDADTVVDTSHNSNDQEEDLLEQIEKWKETNLQRLGCTAHGLNLVLKECVLRNLTAKKLIDVVARIVSFFTQSPYWSNKLTKKTGAGLVKPGTTRWNSTVFALERILQDGFIEGINSIISRAKSQRVRNVPDSLSTEMVDSLREMASLLVPFIEATNRLQSDCVTSSLVLGTITCLYKGIARISVSSEEMKDFQRQICVLVVERFASTEQFEYSGRGAKKQLLQIFKRQEYIIATLLDPRVKLNPFEMSLPEPFGLDNYRCSVHQARSILEKAANDERAPVSQDIIEEIDGPEPTEENIFGGMFGSSSNSSINRPATRSPDDEIQKYFEEPMLPETSDPLKFWQKRSAEYPILSKLARRHLAFPATSGSVERLFSISGAIIRSHRARLNVSTVENILLCREDRLM